MRACEKLGRCFETQITKWVRPERLAAGFKPLDSEGSTELGSPQPLPIPTPGKGKRKSGTERPVDEPPPSCIIDPDAEWKQSWDLVILVLILYSSAAVPVQIAFEADSTPLGFQWCMEVVFSLCFLTDVAFNFNLGYYSEGLLVADRSKIIPDTSRAGSSSTRLVGARRVDRACVDRDVGATPHGLAMLRVLRMFRLVRLLRLLKVDAYMSRLEEEFEINLRAIRLVQLILETLFMSHMLGCAWMAVATFVDEPESRRG